jgi:hypothetical protein
MHNLSKFHILKDIFSSLMNNANTNEVLGATIHILITTCRRFRSKISLYKKIENGLVFLL